MLRFAPILLVAVLALTACAPVAEAPRLLSGAEIAAATQGSATPPDNSALQARAARLSARAAQLRGSTIQSHEDDLRRRRGLN
jgi:hypothetical protein